MNNGGEIVTDAPDNQPSASDRPGEQDHGYASRVARHYHTLVRSGLSCEFAYSLTAEAIRSDRV